MTWNCLECGKKYSSSMVPDKAVCIECKISGKHIEFIKTVVGKIDDGRLDKIMEQCWEKNR